MLLRRRDAAAVPRMRHGGAAMLPRRARAMKYLDDDERSKRK